MVGSNQQSQLLYPSGFGVWFGAIISKSWYDTQDAFLIDSQYTYDATIPSKFSDKTQK